MENVNKEKIVADLKVVLDDAEQLLKLAATSTGEKATELRTRATEAIRRASDQMADLQDLVVVKGKAAARATDDYVHDHPWQAVGIAAGVGFLVGLIVNRR